MPRLPTALLRKASTIDPLLPPLLGQCRDLRAASNELRWLREHVENVARTRCARRGTLSKISLLSHLVKQRASGKPLQYILGTEYFGELELRCRPGVLIPRQETAASVSHLARLISAAQNLPSELRVLDLCTGSGCIPLLFQHEFCPAHRDTELRLLGVDVSEKALKLATHNLQRVQKSQKGAHKYKIEFLQADVLLDPVLDEWTKPPIPLKVAFNVLRPSIPQFWDILISNPPYISPSAYWKTTTRSVRGHEPKLALVPPAKAGALDTATGDMFYPRLFDIARDIEAKIVLLEVADLDQALRVAQHAHDRNIFDGIEIWRDAPDMSHIAEAQYSGDIVFPIIGQGNARSVFCWRGPAGPWLQRRGASEAEDASRLMYHGRPPFGPGVY